MDIFAEHKEYFLAFTIPVTIIVIIASLAYTIRNISRIWSAGKLVAPAPEEDEQLDENNSDQEDADKQSDRGTGDRNIDPVQYCEHIQSEVKKARQRVATQEIREKLTEEDMENERELQRKQIEDIFKLMEQHTDKFGVASEDDVRQQMRLYV